MLTEIKGALTNRFKDKPLKNDISFKNRIATLQTQEIDDLHPSDNFVMQQIFDCASCPGRKQEINRLLLARDRIEKEVTDSFDKSVLHKIDGKLALCSSCGQKEKPRVLIKSA
jgi:hypothetical protein